MILTDKMESDAYAETDCLKKEILLSSDPAKLEVIRETLLHEAIHALLGESGLGEAVGERIEEGLCQAFESGLPRIVKEIYR